MMPGRSAVRRVGYGVLVVAALALVALGLGRVETTTSLESLLPEGDPALGAYQRSADRFGGDPIVVLLEAKKSSGEVFLDQERLPDVIGLESTLAGLEGVATVYGPGTLLNQIATRAQDLLAELTGRRDAEIALARARAQERGAGEAAIVQAGRQAQQRFDARYGPLLVEGMPGGLPTMSNQRFVERVVFGEAGEPRGQWRFVVPNRSSAAVLVRPEGDLDAGASARLVADIRSAVADLGIPATTVTVSGVPVLVAGLSERAEHDAPRLGAVAIAVIAGCLMLAVWLPKRRRLVPLATTLVAVAGTLAVAGWIGIPVSLAVIAFCPVLLGIGCYYPTYLAMGAPVRTVLVVASATAASLLTLALSPLPLVGDLGIVLGIGVALSALLVLPLRGWLVRDVGEGAPAGSGTGPGDTARPSRAVPLRWALGGAVVLGLSGWLLLPGIAIQSDVDHFAGGLQELDDARHVEDVLGSAGQVSVMVRGADVLSPQSLAWMTRATDTLVAGHGDQVRPVLSPSALVSFVGQGATVGEIDAAWRLLPEYLTGATVTPGRDAAVLTFGVRVDDLGDVRRTRAAFDDAFSTPPAGLEADVVGLPLVLLQGEEAISSDRLTASLAGVGAAVAVLLLGLRRRSDALRALAAAILATGLGFLLVGALGFSLSPITVALGALTTAVGSEFTIVLAEAARNGERRLRSGVGIAALTSAGGYLVLVVSGLGVVREFGLLLTGSVALAALSSWLVVEATVRPPAPRHDVPEVEPEKELCRV